MSSMESEFQKLKLRPSDLSTVHEFDERSTLTKQNVKLLEKKKQLQNYIDNDDDDDYDEGFTDDMSQYLGDSDTQREGFIDYKIKNQIDMANQNISISNINDNNDINDNNNNKKPAKTPKKLKSVLKSNLHTPMGNQMYTIPNTHSNDANMESEGSSLSSRTPSSVHSQYSESDTENSDYAADYDEFKKEEEEIKNINLTQMFKRKQIEAIKRAEEEKKFIQAQYLRTRNNNNNNNNKSISKKSHPYTEMNYGMGNIEDITNDIDFEGMNIIDPSKLIRFRTNSSPIMPTSLGRKKSLPIMRMVTSINGSPKKVKKYMSTMDMNSELKKIPKSTYTNFNRYTKNEPDNFDNLNDFDYDLTITLSDYEKLKRKSQNFDFSKYVENPSQHEQKRKYHKDSRYKKYIFDNENDSKTARLTKAGKIKLIRSLGKPKVRKVMPGHMYGEIVYDPQLNKWCGNEEDLFRFDSIGYVKPQLITKQESIPQVVGNMMYDDKNLRWVSMTGNYEDDPFGDEFDTIINEVNDIEKKKPNIVKSDFARGFSGKLIPSESSRSLADHLKKRENFYKVTPEMYKNWKTEESRWIRKVGNWFPTEGDSHGFKYELKAFLNQQ